MCVRQHRHLTRCVCVRVCARARGLWARGGACGDLLKGGPEHPKSRPLHLGTLGLKEELDKEPWEIRHGRCPVIRQVS